jgi:thymus-specific serine protease
MKVVVTGSYHCGWMIVLAERHGALIVAVEHRFYGESYPTDDLTTESLSYLSSRQALEDLATIHEHIMQQFGLTTSNQWISFGGSYPGMMAGWFRLKYPHLVTAAIASSAPVQARVRNRLQFTICNVRPF